MRGSSRFPLVFVFSATVLSALLLGWALRGSGIVANCEIHDVSVCEELDEQLRPIGGGSPFCFGIRQLGVRFRFRLARQGESIQVRWFYQNHLIHEEALSVEASEGVKAFYLVREDGAPLPVGDYHVSVAEGGRQAFRLDFSIEEPASQEPEETEPQEPEEAEPQEEPPAAVKEKEPQK